MPVKIPTNVKSLDDVRRALVQIEQHLSNLTSTASGQGAALIGVEEAGSVWTGTDLETVLDEIDARLVAGGH